MKLMAELFMPGPVRPILALGTSVPVLVRRLYRMSYDPMDLTFGRAIGRTRQATIAGQVMGLLGFSLLFTAGGAFVGRTLGPAAMLLSIIGSLACVFALSLARQKMSSIVALGVFYLFSVFEGMALGLIIDSYLQRG